MNYKLFSDCVCKDKNGSLKANKTQIRQGLKFEVWGDLVNRALTIKGSRWLIFHWEIINLHPVAPSLHQTVHHIAGVVEGTFQNKPRIKLNQWKWKSTRSYNFDWDYESPCGGRFTESVTVVTWSGRYYMEITRKSKWRLKMRLMIFVVVVLCKVTGSIQVVIKFGSWLKF